MHQARVRTFSALALTWICSGSVRAQEGGIEVFAGETLFGQGWRVSESYLYKRKGTLFRGSDDVSDPQDRLFEEHRAVTGVDYGLLPSFTLSMLLPVVYKRQEMRVDGRRDTRESFGLGDVALLGKYRIFKHDWERSAFNLALLGGLETPTGETDADENGVRLPPSLQPGSGSWDPFVAIAATLSLDLVRFDGIAFFKANTEGSQDFEEGDFFALEFDAAYRFWLEKYPGPAASAKVGFQWRHQERDELRGASVASSGSDEIVVRTGLSFHLTPGTDLSVSVDVPVYHDVNGTQLARDVRAFVAFGVRF